MERRKTGTYISCKYTKESVELLAGWCVENSIHEPLAKRHFHTTVLYSRADVPTAQSLLDIMGYGSGRAEPKTIELSVIGFKLFHSIENPDCASLVLEFKAPELVDLHQVLIDNGGVHDYDYTPHVTVSYKADKNTDLSKLILPTFKMVVNKFKVEPLDLDWKE